MQARANVLHAWLRSYTRIENNLGRDHAVSKRIYGVVERFFQELQDAYTEQANKGNIDDEGIRVIGGYIQQLADGGV